MRKLKLPSRRPSTADVVSEKTVASEAPAEPKEATSAKPATPAKPKRKRVKTPRLKLHYASIGSAWKLFRASVSEFRADWKPYVKILVIVAIPSNIIALLNVGGDQSTSSYVSFFSVVMNVALLWAMVQRHKTGKVPGIAAAYYDGSVALVRFILLSFALVLMLVPAALGISLYVIGLQVSQVSGIFGPEQLLVLLVVVILTIPSFYWLVRYTLAPFAAVRDGLRPVAALRRARILTLGRFWPVAGRLALLVLLLVLYGLPIIVLTVTLSIFKLNTVSDFLFSTLATLTVLPVANLFMFRLYGILEQTFDEATAEALEGITQAAAASAKA